MPRAKYGAARHRKKVRLFKAAKGYRGARSKLWRTAKEAVMRGRANAYRDRRQKKRNFRSLWVMRLNAACRERGINYSCFIAGLTRASVIVNRKVMSQIAIEDPAGFDALVEVAKANQPAKSAA